MSGGRDLATVERWRDGSTIEASIPSSASPAGVDDVADTLAGLYTLARGRALDAIKAQEE